MSHTKSQGSAKRLVNVVGKRRGIKRYSGQFVNCGEILVRQLGTKFHPGQNTSIGKDFTIHATIEGIVGFRNMSGHHRTQKFIDVLPTEVKPDAEVVEVVEKKAKPATKKKSSKTE